MKPINVFVANLFILCICMPANSATYRVGPQHSVKLPSQAAIIAKNGDVIEIEAGLYLKDAAVWRADNLLIRGVNGKARLMSEGYTSENKAIWVIKGNNTTVENIEFSSASVPDKNGAGIRLEGKNLTIQNCSFYDNENGILTGANPNSEVLIEKSEFSRNGYGDGQSHNIYIGAIHKFILRDSVSRLAKIGHQVKSRASINIIENNVIEDGETGQSSYLIDLPAGGEAHITGNFLQQGKNTENYTMVSYGVERLIYDVNVLNIVNNVFVNDRRDKCRLIWIKPINTVAKVFGNKFCGCNRVDGVAVFADNMSFIECE